MYPTGLQWVHKKLQALRRKATAFLALSAGKAAAFCWKYTQLWVAQMLQLMLFVWVYIEISGKPGVSHTEANRCCSGVFWCSGSKTRLTPKIREIIKLVIMLNSIRLWQLAKQCKKNYKFLISDYRKCWLKQLSALQLHLSSWNQHKRKFSSMLYWHRQTINMAPPTSTVIIIITDPITQGW